MQRYLIATCALILLCTGQVARAEQLLAGVATQDITPPAGLRMWGYADRTRGATGALDRLTAKALVLKVADTAVAIVALDLGRVPEDAVLRTIRETTARECGIDNLFVTASHTHSAPSVESTADKPNDFAVQVGKQIAEGVCRAAKSLVPVRIGIGRGTADLAHNRRRFLADGRVAMQWRNEEREPTEPVDMEYAVIRLDRVDGSPLAVLLHYACHPVVLGSDNLEYSADFVGTARDTIERELETTSLFLQGGCGNINPYVDKTPRSQGGVEAMRKMGRELGELVAATAKSTKTEASAQPSLRFESRIVPIRTRWDLADPEVRATLSKAFGPRFDNYIAPSIRANQVSCTLTTVLIGDNVALVGMPGEFFVQFQQALKTNSPVPGTFLVGYTNGYHAYFPTLRDAAAGGYGGKTATYVEPGAGERMTDQALITLYRMTNQLHDKPRPEDFRLLEYDAIRSAK